MEVNSPARLILLNRRRIKRITIRKRIILILRRIIIPFISGWRSLGWSRRRRGTVFGAGAFTVDLETGELLGDVGFFALSGCDCVGRLAW